MSFYLCIYFVHIEQRIYFRFQVLTTARMKFRFVFWDILPCKVIVDRRFRGTCCLRHQSEGALMIEAARTSEMLVDNYFTRQYIPEDKSELQRICCLFIFTLKVGSLVK
jgi:hypothetical protein